MYKSISVVFSVMMFLSVLFTPAMAGQKTISLQGKLTAPTSNYAPITGVHTLYFRLYAAPTGGSVLWTEQHLVNLPNNGVFNVVLGSSSTLDAIAFNRPYYVGIVVDGTNEMMPRQPLSATPYSFGSISDMNVGKDLYVVGNSSVACSLFVSSNVAVSGSMNLTKDLNVSGKVNVGTALVVSSSAVVSGNTVLGGSVTINGAVCTNYLNSYSEGKNLEIMHGGNGYGDILFGTQLKTERMRITNAGSVGIGTIPVYSLDVAGPGVPTVNIRHASGRLYVNNIGCNTGQTLSLLVKTNVPKMMINTTDETYTLNVNGDAKCTGVWKTSDVRLKKNIRPLADDGVVYKVSRLQAIKYKYDKSKMMQVNKGAEDNDAQKKYMEKEAKEIGISVAELKQKREDDAYAYCDDEQIGLSAQELEKEFPELVKTDKNGYKAVNYDGLTVILIEALKKQQLAINDLEARVRNLESMKK